MHFEDPLPTFALALLLRVGDTGWPLSRLGSLLTGDPELMKRPDRNEVGAMRWAVVGWVWGRRIGWRGWVLRVIWFICCGEGRLGVGFRL